MSQTEATVIYYFTEIKDMKGRIIYHQWLHEGKVVFKSPFKILGKRWRVATSKSLGYSAQGQWIVRSVDKAGKIYNEIVFDVVGQ